MARRRLELRQEAQGRHLVVHGDAPDGGFPAEQRYYSSPQGKAAANVARERVDWGGMSARQSNPWVTVDALAVLAAAQA